jgi:hypothetical protein
VKVNRILEISQSTAWLRHRENSPDVLTIVAEDQNKCMKIIPLFWLSVWQSAKTIILYAALDKTFFFELVELV